MRQRGMGGENLSLSVGLAPAGVEAVAPAAVMALSDRRDERFEDLYTAHYDRLCRLAAVLTGRPEIAEELVQDSFIKIRPRLANLDRPEAYLTTTVVNAARSYQRRLGVELRHLTRTRPTTQTTVTQGGRPEVLDLLRRLPTNERVALGLRFLEDWTDAEIADTLGCAEATVRYHIHKAKQRLRRELKEVGTR